MAVAKGQGEHWSSRVAFVLAAIGSAVGLGNFWRFPYMAGENGGGAFVIVYFFCVSIVSLPILMAELFIGRRGATDAPGSVRNVALEDGHSPRWSVIGWIGMIAAFLILSFYSVIGGWVIAYIPLAFQNAFAHINAEQSGALFNDMLKDPVEQLLYHALFMVITAYIVARGVHRGIELAVEILMPAFFVMLLGVVAYSIVTGDTAQGFSFLFHADFSKITPTVVLDAIGQAFFSIGVGTAIMLTYGSYLTRQTNITHAAGYIVVSDTLVALLAGIAIFPLVFAFGLDPAEGPGLIFVTLPVAFGQMHFGAAFAVVFFALALFAAITSSISMLEIAVRRLVEHHGMSRVWSASILALIAWLLGIGSILSLSTNALAAWHPLTFIPLFKGQGFFDILDTLTSNVMLPLAGLLEAVFAGWVLSKALALDELDLKDGRLYAVWQFCLRYVSPICVGTVLIYLAILKPFLR